MDDSSADELSDRRDAAGDELARNRSAIDNNGVRHQISFDMSSIALTPADDADATRARSLSPQRERWYLAIAAILLTTFFALLYALRGGITLLDRGQSVVWSDQVIASLLVWWTCLPLLPALAWLVRHSPLRDVPGRPVQYVRSLSLLLSGVMLVAIVRHFALTPVVTWLTGVPDVAASTVARILTYFTTFLVMSGLLYAVYFVRDLRERELDAARLARSLAEARLVALRAQLQPHFVFNVLNAISAQLHTDVLTADRMLTRFAALLRSLLQASDTELHTLRDELAVLRQYTDLMQLRFGETLRIEWDVDDALLESQVPWMILQPLVENAIEHGLSERQNAGSVRVSVSRDAQHLRLTVEDDGVGLAPQTKSAGARAVQSSGVGLRNVRERLTQHYQSHASVSLEPRAGGGACAVVRIPMSVAAA